MDYPDGLPKRLSKFDNSEAFPSWSPDSKWIVFATWASGGGELYKVNVEGRPRPVQLTHKPALYQQPTWSANGRIVFIQGPAQKFDDAYNPFAPDLSAEIAWVASNGGTTTVIDRTIGRHSPHFINKDDRIYLSHFNLVNSGVERKNNSKKSCK